MYLEQVGIMKIKNATTGAYSELAFKAEGWGGRNKHDVMGYIYENEDACKKKKSSNSYYLQGKYSQYVNVWKTDDKGNHPDPSDSEPDIKLWVPNPMPDRFEHQYFFTHFAISLNNLPDKLARMLPHSDSRFRPDLRAYEEGKMEEAATEKFRLEEKQRAARKLRELGKIPEFESKYFTKELDENLGIEYYVYGKKRDYWRDRRRHDFSHMEDIY
jgi:hypothetical protein